MDMNIIFGGILSISGVFVGSYLYQCQDKKREEKIQLESAQYTLFMLKYFQDTLKKTEKRLKSGESIRYSIVEDKIFEYKNMKFICQTDTGREIIYTIKRLEFEYEDNLLTMLRHCNDEILKIMKNRIPSSGNPLEEKLVFTEDERKTLSELEKTLLGFISQMLRKISNIINDFEHLCREIFLNTRGLFKRL